MDSLAAYQVLREPRHETLRVRGIDIHLTRWGPAPSESAPPIFLLHGWLDCGETFQFVVDALQCEWPLVALDWRGFGRSEWPQDGYWFPDGQLVPETSCTSAQCNRVSVGSSGPALP